MQPRSFTMKVFVLVLAFFSCEALDCGIHMKENRALVTSINKCFRNHNKTLEDLWDMTSTSKDSSSSSSEEESATTNVDGKMSQNFRMRRNVVVSRYQEEQNETESNQNSADEGDKKRSSEETVSENCMIQCIFQDMDLTDENGYPQHGKLAESLLKNAQGRELRDFIQDTTDECFQETEKEKSLDTCMYSSKLVSCLAEKGRANCSDWPAGDLPLR